MRLTSLIALVFLPALLNGQVIDSVNVFYLPWKFNIEGEITDDLIRNYPGYSKEIKITDKGKIDSLILSLSIFNLRLKESNPKVHFSPRMIIDVFSHEKKNNPNSPVFIYSIKLDQRQNMIFQDHIYCKNTSLEEWINKNVHIE